MRGALVLFAVAGLAMPSHASACGQYSRAYERHLAREQKSYLNYADLSVIGTWRQSPTGDNLENSDMQIVRGYLVPDKGGDKAKIELSFFPEINCGFPVFPQDNEHGSFFLRADISPGNYLDETVDYELLHFISDRKRH